MVYIASAVPKCFHDIIRKWAWETFEEDREESSRKSRKKFTSTTHPPPVLFTKEITRYFSLIILKCWDSCPKSFFSDRFLIKGKAHSLSFRKISEKVTKLSFMVKCFFLSVDYCVPCHTPPSNRHLNSRFNRSKFHDFCLYANKWFVFTFSQNVLIFSCLRILFVTFAARNSK